MPDLEKLANSLDTQLRSARATNERRIVVLSGEQQWSNLVFCNWFKLHEFRHACSVGSLSNNNIDIKEIENHQAGQLLGQNIDCLYYDAWSGFDPDAFAALVGALSGGGLLILAIPPMNLWTDYYDPDYHRILVYPTEQKDLSRRFLQLLQKSLRLATNVLIAEQAGHFKLYNRSEVDEFPLDKISDNTDITNKNCVTADQQNAVDAIIKVALGRSHRPLVINSDRGRGKTTALGIASAYLLQNKKQKIIITAPRFDSAKTALEHSSKILGKEVVNKALVYGDSSLSYVPPDALIRNQYSADLLLIDEAASIPASMLVTLLKNYKRIVFSTTIHGYEGTGKGFEIRFKKVLNNLTPQWKNLQIHQPIRWAGNDPVERWLFDALLLDAKTADESKIESLVVDQCITEIIDRDHLLKETELLKQIFGLLVVAHYQTTAADLRNMLDGPNITIWVTRFNGQVVAAALVAEEGDLDAEISRSIWQGERRPRGHLLPQTLSFHSGFEIASRLRFQRIIRIAVHPGATRRGLGNALVAAIARNAGDRKFDFVGASFAATADVMAFWYSTSCTPVRLGFSVDARSGCHSAIVLKALSSQGEDLSAMVRRRFINQFYFELPLCFKFLDSELVVELLQGFDAGESIELDKQDWLDIEAFSEGKRPVELCSLPLSKLVFLSIAQGKLRQMVDSTIDGAIDGLNDGKGKKLLINRLLQNRSQVEVSQELGYSGKKEQVTALRDVVKRLKVEMHK